ncbi:MAG: alpha/beta fold hydrolase [Acidobacteriota bacterium]|nr:MAG: alpha/beta fold hydrolase [Acidobacteriota bacterium]
MSDGHHFKLIQTVLEQKPFRPHRLLPTGHLQTVIGARQRRTFDWGWKSIRQENLKLRDDSTVQVKYAAVKTSAPTVVVIHGMAGSSESAYMLGLSKKAYVRGWNSILLDLYNHNPDRVRPKVFHAGCSDEVAEILELVSNRYTLQSFFLVGLWMGGNILLKLLGELGAEAAGRIVGGAVISPLVDLTESWPVFDHWSNWLYKNYYLGRLRRLTLQNPGSVENWVDLDHLARVRTIREFDEVVTVPLGGFSTVDEYYRKASSAPLLDRIAVPTLIIHSQDDPLLPSRPLVEKASGNPNLCLHLTPRGGHVAFVERRGIDRDRSWAENRVIDFFETLGT